VSAPLVAFAQVVSIVSAWVAVLVNVRDDQRVTGGTLAGETGG